MKKTRYKKIVKYKDLSLKPNPEKDIKIEEQDKEIEKLHKLNREQTDLRMEDAIEIEGFKQSLKIIKDATSEVINKDGIENKKLRKHRNILTALCIIEAVGIGVILFLT